jgi:hypothetical protein
MVGWMMDIELGRIWKGEVVAYYRYYPGAWLAGLMKTTKASVRIFCAAAEVWNLHLQGRYCCTNLFGFRTGWGRWGSRSGRFVTGTVTWRWRKLTWLSMTLLKKDRGAVVVCAVLQHLVMASVRSARRLSQLMMNLWRQQNGWLLRMIRHLN